MPNSNRHLYRQLCGLWSSCVTNTKDGPLIWRPSQSPALLQQGTNLLYWHFLSEHKLPHIRIWMRNINCRVYNALGWIWVHREVHEWSLIGKMSHNVVCDEYDAVNGTAVRWQLWNRFSRREADNASSRVRVSGRTMGGSSCRDLCSGILCHTILLTSLFCPRSPLFHSSSCIRLKEKSQKYVETDSNLWNIPYVLESFTNIWKKTPFSIVVEYI